MSEWIAMADRRPADFQLVIFYDAANDWFVIGDIRFDGHFHVPLINPSAGTIDKKQKRSIPASQVTYWQSLEGLAFTPNIETRSDRRTQFYMRFTDQVEQIPSMEVVKMPLADIEIHPKHPSLRNRK